MRILYDSKNTEYKKPFGTVKEGEECSIKIAIPSSCCAIDAEIILKNDHTGEETRFLMVLKESDGTYDSFECTFTLPCAGLYFYKFFVHTKESDFELFKEGFADTNIGAGDMWQLSCIPKDFSVPTEFCGKVMYQIFPDRFFKDGECDLSDKLQPFYIHENKDDIPAFRPNEQGKVLNCDFYGGNLKGIEKKLPYLKELGVSIIYLNPIFKAYSNHRYDTCDYKTIDPMLGTESDFVSLCNSAHKLGIKIILDGVFSHTGSNSIYFDKEHIFGNGALSNENSPFKSWYNFSEYPHKYDAWWGIETLPAVNELDSSYLDYIIRDGDSVLAHWLNLGADGFRLDVADELPDEFIYLLRKKVKEIKPNSLVIGEVWEDASNKISYGVRRRYFTGAELDSVMNYVFKNAIIAFATGDLSAADFANEIMTIAENYPKDSLNSLMNSLSTHDTARILTCLSGCNFPESKEEQSRHILTETEYALATERLFLASFLQYVLPGTACIYYGDEIGMQGFGDPFCRGYFKWDNINERLLAFFKELGKIKNSFKSLQKGDIKIDAKDGVLIIERTFSAETFVAVINMSNKEYELCHGDAVIFKGASKVGDKLYIEKAGFAAYIK
ncbi:MAG: glycoside hydrolase family 13 protein [Clostridia bacterium]|nr:glycoside hydrolase family 13 protein [Clostridia bacterium]